MSIMNPSRLRGGPQTAGGIVVLTALLVLTAPLSAQRSTELFIPLGQSPGLSGILAAIGEVESLDTVTKTLTVRSGDDSVEAQITDSTSIWLDRSREQRSAVTGSRDDIQTGLRVEIKFVDSALRRRAEWIKVEMR